MALGLLGGLILLAISTALNLALRPRIKRPRAPDLEFPKADEGVPIPIGYGRFVVAPNIVWWGNAAKGGPANDSDVFTFYFADMIGTLCLGPVDAILDIQAGGKSLRFEPQTNDQGGEVCFPGMPANNDSPDNPIVFTIHAQQMFGGFKQEGGLEGEIRFHLGGLDQEVDALTTQYMTDPDGLALSAGTARPGVCYAAFARSESIPVNIAPAFYWGTVPTPKDITFILKHSPDALGVGMPFSDDANPAEIIYDLLVSNLRGLGLNPDLIDTDNFTAVATTLLNEGLGLSGVFSDQDEVEDMIDDVLKHIMGVLRINPVTGQYELKLARGDYFLSDCPRITNQLRGASYGNAKNIKLTRPNYRETTNDIQLTYRRFFTSNIGGVTGQVLTSDLDYILDQFIHFDTHATNISLVTLYDDGVAITSGFTYDSAAGTILLTSNSGAEEGSVITVDYVAGPIFNGYKEATTRWQDLAAIRQSGEIRSQTFDYPFFTTDLNAGRHVARLGQQMGRSLYQLQCEMDRTGYSLSPGDVVRLNYVIIDASGNDFEVMDDVPFRVTEIDYGLLEDGKIVVSGTEDVWAADVAPILPPPLSGGGGPGSGGGSGGGATLPAPAIGIAQAANSAITICFYPADTNFNIEIHRATSADGASETTLSSSLPGTTTCGTETQVVGTVLYYRARLVPTISQIGYTVGPWSEWVQMTAASGTVAACEAVMPTFVETVA